MTDPKAKKYLSSTTRYDVLTAIQQIETFVPLTASQAIVQFRNRITHEYDRVDDVNVWAILVKHLPKLKEETESLLNQ